ncbi:16S rRNA (cytosine(967)-C(5))-methyltransferase RsmB [Rhodohalobacter barkolensis]|uniref:16S rRNA (cytosine(967)-C(5))-methyltransferase n=1 Tax=Rhodohalobacter barkolensis TaxID=2053187 RepID=A0A2N0VIZ3_9BACT|nr:16S rRNA (cytosine(967)-C(5))-methyltransferase RsmB [Rhodohalobacter barkolensis]PKD44153.1 16S rRNA (cytosine(967)-C(5))-methyltransferase RsmB [Rhodohalobacter barkolensis]
MDTEQTARSVSIELLEIFDDKKSLNYSLANDLEPRERAQVREYVQNILRKRSYLDFIIGEYSSITIDEMKPVLKNILRLGLYEMLFMDGTPDYAAINEAVELAKLRLGSKAGDLVNAILRNIQRDIDNLPKPAFEDRTKLIATTFSHPEWMVKRWVKRFGEREAFQLMQSNNQRPFYYVRVNNLRTKTENFKLRMEKLDIPFDESEWLPGYYKVDSVAPFIEKDLLKKGICLVQDIAAGFAPTILEPEPGETIYDLCAAPGTKSIVMSDMMNAEGSIIAVDISAQRLELLAESAMDYRAENIKIRQDDVRDLNLKLADGVLLDAPCTGTGVLSKRADLRWKRTEEELENSVKLQEELLDEAANHVKRGGRLVYSTCSIEPEENWEQIQKFLEKYDNFELEKLDEFLPEEVLVEDGYAYQTLPHIHGCDGHFGVRLKRVK